MKQEGNLGEMDGYSNLSGTVVLKNLGVEASVVGWVGGPFKYFRNEKREAFRIYPLLWYTFSYQIIQRTFRVLFTR